MKKILLLISSLTLLLSSCQRVETMEQLTDRVFAVAAEQCKIMDARLADDELPRSIKADGSIWNSDYKWWCSGFFPGTCWYVYEKTGDEALKAIAEKNTKKLELVPVNVDNHDLGFMIWCSYGNALRLTGDEQYLPVIKAAAEKLAGRFNTNTGTIQSWAARPERDWLFPVIIDNMMNLELLEESTKLFGEPKFDEVARTHANTTIANHFREDNSSFHVVDYDPATGAIRHKNTAQGWQDSSAWGRGQSWGQYGYAMMYRFTGDEKYLEQSEKISEYLINNLPEDGITYWDFNVPGIPYAPRDASAAAVEASAFVQLCTLTKDPAKAATYKAMAEKILRELASPEYLAEPGTNNGFILKHSVGHFKQNSEVDQPLTYADYYFLEALLKYAAL